MVTVRICKNNEGQYYKYVIEGHANYDKFGKDIVCAAISAISQTILITLDEICDLKYEKGNGYLEVIVLNNNLDDVQLLFKTLKNGIKAIELQYPQYLKLETP